MLSWISGTRNSGANDAEDVSSIEPPITPAPVFAVRAFKQVLFGTPQPNTPAPIFSSNGATKSKDTDSKPERRQLRPSDEQLKRYRQNAEETNGTMSGDVRSKPQGILMTPGTAAGRRKQVKFGKQVVDNESKRSKYSKSGLPDNFPGKFPSPWTPKTTPASLRVQAVSATDNAAENAPENGPQNTPQNPSKSTSQESRENAGTLETEPHPKTPSRSKDDADVTLDLNLPRSASGQYWKDQYDSYSAKSESEVKRLIMKHKIAKDYAHFKDGEAIGLKTQLESEQQIRQKRERSLERQVKDMRERLREALAENAKISAEVTSLRLELAGLSATTSETKDTSTKSPGEVNQLRRRPHFNTTSLGLDLDDIWLDDDADYEDNSRERKRFSRRSPRSQATSKTPEKARPKQEGVDPVPAKSVSDLTPRLNRATANSPLGPKSPNIELVSNDWVKSNDNVVVIRTLGKEKSTPDIGSVTNESNTTPMDGMGLLETQNTPVSSRKRAARTPESRRLDGKRLDEAKARIAARRQKRENQKVSR